VKPTRAERLEVSAALAPLVRELPRRKVKVYKRETGEVSAEIELRDAIAGIAKGVALEFETRIGVRPLKSKCKACGRIFTVPKRGWIPSVCTRCRDRSQLVCAGVLARPCPRSAPVPLAAFGANRVISRRGCPWVCRFCAARARVAARTSEERATAARRWQTKKTIEERREAGRKGAAAMTPEQRSQRSKIASANTTREDRVAAARKRIAKSTPEQRSEAARKGNATRGESARRRQASKTPQQRSEAARKAWETRRRRK
jgi:hypothetical protein